MAHEDAETGTSRAAGNMNIPMGLSSYATHTLEDVISAGKGNPYFIQINFMVNREIMSNTLQRAEGMFGTSRLGIADS